jgi:hypothetical protein
VVLRLTDDSGFAVEAKVTANYAKRRAWAILADLDPSEASTFLEPATESDAGPGQPRRMTQRDTVLASIARGANTMTALQAVTGFPRASISGRLADLVAMGLLLSPQARGRGRKAVYVITNDGQAAVAAMHGAAA